MGVGGKWMKIVKIAVLILVFFLYSAGFAAAQVGNDTDEKIVKTPPPPKKDCPSEEACTLWGEFKEEYGTNWLIKWREYIDAPGTIHGRYSIGRNITDKDDAENISRAFIKDNKDLFKIDLSSLRLSNVGEDWNSYTSVYYQYYDDIRVEGGTVTVTVLKDGAIQMIGNGFYPSISISTTPVITEDEAMSIAKDYFTSGKTWAETSLVILPSDYIELGKAERSDTLRYYLTWKVKFQERNIYVDAGDGEVVFEQENVVALSTPKVNASEPKADGKQDEVEDKSLQTGTTLTPEPKIDKSAPQETPLFTGKRIATSAAIVVTAFLGILMLKRR